MSCGATQNLAASVGCPPYTWSLSGGGTLTPSGGDNTSATYTAPASNPNCANNAMITLTDCCRNIAEIKIAVNCYNPNDYAYKKFYLEEGKAGACVNNVWIGFMCAFSGRCPGGNFFCGYSNLAKIYNCVGGNAIWPYGFVLEGDWFITCEAGERCPHITYPGTGLDRTCKPYGALYPIRSQVQCGLYEAEAPLLDVRTPEMIENGCCPINPDTGLPFDDGIPNSEDRAKNEGEPPCEGTTGNPVNVATGNKFEKSLDLSISPPGIPKEFRRSYNSQITFNGPLGYGWTHTYDVSLGVVQTSPIKRIRIWDSDGRALYFSEVQQTSTEILFGGESGGKDRLTHIISTGEYFL